jgi:hypothetical protein
MTCRGWQHVKKQRPIQHIEVDAEGLNLKEKSMRYAFFFFFSKLNL